MSDLINTYPVFESSQVLTSSQLNQVVSYLDQQNRLTRVKLIGMGVVCGLELSYDDSGTNTQITISKGTAITSEGFLITLGECETSWYRPYELPEGVQYNPFDDPEQDVTLYELLKELPEDNTDVVPLDDDPEFLDDKFVLLFLEIFDNDLKSCLGNTCDESGIDRIFTVRKLLISKGDLDSVLEHSANVGNLYPDKFDLPDIVMPRTLFDPDGSHSQDYTAFSEHYAATFIDSVYPALFGDHATPGVLSETYSAYELLLGTHYDFTNPFETPAVEALENTWTDFMEGTASPGPDYRGIQYFYDFLKDLILAYNEFREAAFDLMSECCPDLSLFPKHVMLGRAIVPNETAEEADTYRHGFAQPPIYNHQKYLMGKTVSLHKRLVLMVETFNLERVNNPNLEGEDIVPLHITPSDEKNTLLSERSIPYYYDSKEEVAVVGEDSLEQHWNFDITRKKLPGTTALTLSYENQADDQSAIISPLETPLYYALDPYPFLRIEGHIGRDYEEVINLINTMKSTFDLPFDTVALQLNPDAGLLELDYSCGFEDLQEEYAVARNTYCGFVLDLMRLFEFIRENEDTILDGDGDTEDDSGSTETEEDLERIGEILDSLNRLCELMTDCLDEFDFAAFQETYKITLQRILDFVLKEKRLLDEIDVDAEDADEQLPIINGMIQRLSPILFRFVDMLFYNTFLRVYYAFRRREHYLQRETGVFSAYIRRYPGVEHQAGVPKGGTFILVHDSNEDQAVIADFNLPYLCCSTDRCVPMCEEEDSEFVFDATPFARPDYAITTPGTPVEIDVSLNDYGFWNTEFSVNADEESANGGRIRQLSEDGRLEYEPPEDPEFSDFDTFQYRLTNNETGAEDTGTVTVLVKEPQQQEPPDETGCYSAEILRCWGIESVQSALRVREIDFSSMTEEEMVDELWQSLRRTGGFSDEEIDGPILEDTDSRRRLIRCIDNSVPAEDMDREELGNWIRQYQNENCGSIIEDNTEDPGVEVMPNDVTMNELRVVLEDSRNVEVSSDATRADLDNLLSNTTHGMRLSRDEVSMFTKDRIMRMLRNREVDFSSSSTKSELVNMLFNQ